MDINNRLNTEEKDMREKVHEKVHNAVKKVMVFSQKLGKAMAVTVKDIDDSTILSTWNDSWNNDWRDHWNNSWFNSGWINRSGWSKGSGGGK